MRVLRAPAKVNLYLGVRPELDERGYHRVSSVMAELALADEVVLEKADGLSVRFSPAIDAPAEKTAVWRAARALAEACGREPNVRITVVRHVPVQAGLGGASSDAAAVLRALCDVWGVDAKGELVQRIAKFIGADVPFFLFGGVCWLTGCGDELRERFVPNPLAALPVVLVRAEGEGVATPAAYTEFDRTRPAAGELEPLLEALRAGEADAALARMANNLEPVALSLSLGCAQVRAWLAQQSGVRAAMVAGSGSCVFAVCESNEAAERIADAARAFGHWSCATRFA